MGSSTIDWNRNLELLLNGSEAAIRRFLAEKSVIDLCAIGYTFELGNASQSFFLCANSREYLAKTLESYRRDWPNHDEDSVRWNSGDYQFPAGLLSPFDELGPEWVIEAEKLNKLSLEDENESEVYEGIVRISCHALAELASRRTFGEWRELDFNVAGYDDDIHLVKGRDRIIRTKIRAIL